MMEYYKAIKTTDIHTWIDFKKVKLSERLYTTEYYCMTPYILGCRRSTK